MKFVSTIFYSLFTLLLVGIALLFLVPLLPIEHNIAIKIVESGSMEPAIKTGSLVILAPTATYAKDDIITFESISADVPTTHRIVEITNTAGKIEFTTKGDANEEIDTETIPQSSIIGKVLVSVPYAGFVLDFARQPLGFILLVGLPALLIVLGEIEKIWKEVRIQRRLKQDALDRSLFEDDHTVSKTTQSKMMEIGIAVTIIQKNPAPLPVSVKQSFLLEYVWPCVIVCLAALFASASFTGSTVSYFNDVEASLANILRASIVDFSVAPLDTIYTFTNSADDTFVGVFTVTPLLETAALEYNVSAAQVSTSTFCGALNADLGSPIVYTGPLLSFVAGGVTLSSPLTLAVSIDQGVLGYAPGDICVVDIVFEANHISNTLSLGYSDSETVRMTFIAPPLLLPLQSPAARAASTEVILPVEEGEDSSLPTLPPSDTEVIVEIQKEERVREVPLYDINTEPIVEEEVVEPVREVAKQVVTPEAMGESSGEERQISIETPR